jgi:phosphoglycerol transferase MdoB-like AlkP superfamily enzyme
VQAYTQTDLLAKYDVLQGRVPFYGSTIAGEARELCGSGFGFHLLVASTSDLKSCVPARLAAIGYETIAMHGMTGHMFDRANWYRTIGFKVRSFNEQFEQEGLPDCIGAFVGTCDADIAGSIGQRLKEQTPQPYFIHWMTLNSHLPVLVPAPLKYGAPCLAAFSLVPNSVLCSWYQLIANVHQSVAHVALGDLARPTVFVIVGDHAPPFDNPALRSRFSQTDVPYVVLVPRSYDDHSSSLLARNATSSLPGTAKPSRRMP